MRVLITLIAAVLLTACGAIDYRTDDQYSYLTIRLNENDTANIIEGVLTGGDTPIMRTAQAELRPGEIYVTGEANDGRGGVASGSLIAQIAAVDGDLQVRVTSFNFGGYTADQATIDNINRRIADGIAQSSRSDTSGSDFTELTITDTQLSFTIRTPLPATPGAQ